MVHASPKAKDSAAHNRAWRERDEGSAMSLRKLGAATFATVALGISVAGPAAAQNNSQQNGLVNVSTGNVSVLDNARIGVAAGVAATICGVSVGPVAVLAANVDATGVQQTVCNTASGPVTITQA
jgi:hypothetical protein